MNRTRNWAVFAAATLGVVGGCASPPAPADDSGWETDFQACAEVREAATRVPVNLLLTVDSSGSMADGTPVSRWAAATSAFTSFFQDPGASGLGVGLRMWPDPDGCDDLSCDAAACGQPQVPVGDLADPAHQQALIDALAARVPDGGTPLSAALEGAVTWARNHQLSEPDQQAAVALVTDGEPNGCDEDIANIAALAGQAAAEGVPVFVVGIEGSNEAQIDQIAQQGGTGSGYFVGSADVETALLGALQDIQGQVLACTFLLPEGEALSVDLVRVEYVAEGETVLVPRVGSADRCGDGGWYLEGEDRITLCPSTCAEVQDAEVQDVSIEIAVGCECEADPDCPELEICEQNQCVPCGEDDGPRCGIGLDPGESVQGGAVLCGTAAAPGAPGALGWLLAAIPTLGGLAAARRSGRAGAAASGLSGPSGSPRSSGHSGHSGLSGSGSGGSGSGGSASGGSGSGGSTSGGSTSGGSASGGSASGGSASGGSTSGGSGSGGPGSGRSVSGVCGSGGSGSGRSGSGGSGSGGSGSCSGGSAWSGLAGRSGLPHRSGSR